MKENEDFYNDDVNVENGKLIQDVPKSEMGDIYCSLGSITDKLEYLIDNQLCVDANKSINKVTQKELDDQEGLVDFFIEHYITNGTPEMHKQIFTHLGMLTGESIEQTCYEKKEFEESFKKPEDNMDKKSYWLARHSNSGKKSDAVNAFSGKLKEALTDSKIACENEFKASGLSESSTMEDFFKSAGLSKTEIASRLHKYGITAKKNMHEYFKETYADRSDDEIKAMMYHTYALNKAQNYITKGSKDYFVNNKPYEDIKRELEDINKKNKQKPDEQGIEDWIEKTGNKKLKRINGYNQREFSKRIKHKYENKSYIKEPIPEKQVYEAKRKYRSLKTMEEKLDYLVTLNAMEQCKEQLQAGASNKTIDYPAIIASDEFTKEYTNTPNISVIKKYYQNVGKKAGEFTVAFQKERDKLLKGFPEDDPNRLLKANYLAEHTYESGTKRTSFSIISQRITGNSSKMMDTVWNAAHMNLDMTMGEFLKKTGMGETEYNEFFSKNPNITPESKAADIYRIDSFGNEQDPEYAMQKDFFDKTIMKWMQEGKDAFAAKNKIKGEKLKQYHTDANFLASDYKISKIRDWVNETGNKQIEKYINNSYHEVMNEHNKKYVGGESYDQYIRLHTGYDIKNKSVKEKQENLAKSIAASILKTTEKSLDIKKIHSYAKTVKALPGYKDIVNDPEKLDYYLSGEGRISEAKTEALKCVSEVTEESVEAYVKAMKKLQDNMKTSEKRSDKYKEFHKAVDAIGNLVGKYDFSNKADRLAACKELTTLNTILLDKTVTYITDKEKVRTYEDGRDRFDNALDALGNLYEYVPNSRSNITPIVDRINNKRDAKIGSEKYVDIQKYSGKRAEDAKKTRDLKDQNKKAASQKQLGKK